jgi:hypothetical protein
MILIVHRQKTLLALDVKIEVWVTFSFTGEAPLSTSEFLEHDTGDVVAIL